MVVVGIHSDNGSAAFVRCYFPKIRVGNGCYSMFVVVIFVAYIIFQGQIQAGGRSADMSADQVYNDGQIQDMNA